MTEQGPVRIPKGVLEELEAVRSYTRTDALDIPLLRYVTMEREKPALAAWTDNHEAEYGRGLLDGLEAEDLRIRSRGGTWEDREGAGKGLRRGT